MSDERRSAMRKIAIGWRRAATRLRKTDLEMAHRLDLEADYIEADSYKYKLRGYPPIPEFIVVKADGWVSQPTFRWGVPESEEK